TYGLGLGEQLVRERPGRRQGRVEPVVGPSGARNKPQTLVEGRRVVIQAEQRLLGLARLLSVRNPLEGDTDTWDPRALVHGAPVKQPEAPAEDGSRTRWESPRVLKQALDIAHRHLAARVVLDGLLHPFVGRFRHDVHAP